MQITVAVQITMAVTHTTAGGPSDDSARRNPFGVGTQITMVIAHKPAGTIRKPLLCKSQSGAHDRRSCCNFLAAPAGKTHRFRLNLVVRVHGSHLNVR